MTPARLLAHFDRLADAPDAVPRLRRFVLDLAVRGKLVPQDPADEPAAELLKRIATDVAERKLAGEYSDPRNSITLPPASLPFQAHPTWSWVRLVEVADVSYGFAFESARFNNAQAGMPLIRIRDISRTDTEAYYDGPFDDYYAVNAGDFLIGMDGDFNVREWKGKQALLNQRVMRIRGWRLSLVARFLAIPLQMVLDHLHGATSLTTVKHLSAKQVNGIYLPLPPLAEQRRIVEKVDELMALCDQLDAAQAERDERRDRLATAALARLNLPADDAAAFRDHARFALDHLPRLTTRTEHVARLRQTILALAFRGLIVPQEAVEGTTEQVLYRIQQSQAKALKVRGARGSRSPQLDCLSCPGVFDIPPTWRWVYLWCICETIADVDHKMPKAVQHGVPFLSAKDLKDDGTLDFSSPKLISEEDYLRLSRKVQMQRGDIVYSRIGARLGKARLVEVDTRFLISYSCCLIRPQVEYVDRHYLQRFLDSALALGQAHKGTQSIGVPDLGLGEIKSFQVPLPPLAEQRRIVARVDELIAVCDQLDGHLTAAQADRGRLLDAVLHDALHGR